MNTQTIVMMVLVLGSVWGGFAYFIRLAMKKSEEKSGISGEGGE